MLIKRQKKTHHNPLSVSPLSLLSFQTLPHCFLFHCHFSLQWSTTLFFCISLSAACINLITPAWEERIIGTQRGQRQQWTEERRWNRTIGRSRWRKREETRAGSLLKCHVHTSHLLHHRRRKLNSTHAAPNNLYWESQKTTFWNEIVLPGSYFVPFAVFYIFQPSFPTLENSAYFIWTFPIYLIFLCKEATQYHHKACVIYTFPFCRAHILLPRSR